MSTELARNVAHAGLRAPATAIATSLSVELVTGAWPSVPFSALMEDGTSRKEQVLVTGVSGNTLTATRAQGGTTAVVHDTMSSVDVITTTSVHGITNTANVLVTGQTAIAGLGLAAVTNQQLTVQSQAAGSKPLVVKAPASPTADIFRVEASDGTLLLRVSQYGQLDNTYYKPIDGSGSHIHLDTNHVNLVSTVTVGIPCRVRGAAGQTAQLQEWLDSDFNVLSSVGPDGKFKFATGNQQTTVGAAGAASALPATPTVYFLVKNAAGTTLAIPAFAAA